MQKQGQKEPKKQNWGPKRQSFSQNSNKNLSQFKQPSLEKPFAKLVFSNEKGKNDYQFRLQHTEDNRFAFGEEMYRFSKIEYPSPPRWHNLGTGHEESNLLLNTHQTAIVTRTILSQCTVFQFHDTSKTSPLKLNWEAGDNRFLKNNGCNLAAVLLDLKNNERKIYDEIVMLVKKSYLFFKILN